MHRGLGDLNSLLHARAKGKTQVRCLPNPRTDCRDPDGFWCTVGPSWLGPRECCKDLRYVRRATRPTRSTTHALATEDDFFLFGFFVFFALLPSGIEAILL